VPFSNEGNYYHVASNFAKSQDNALFTNQFENLANCRAHYEGTAPEMWIQSGHKIDGFICSAGTGGTISGCSQYLKEVNEKCKIFLVDCMGSGLFNYVKTG
jgi:cysteine synthase A